MLNKLLQPAVKAFIKKHENGDLDRLLFNKNNYPTIPVEFVVNQIRARAKAKYKLPSWYKTEGIIMPPALSMEQCSSESAALYKSNMFSGKLAIDLTGGAGIDSYFLAQRFEKVIYIELNKELAEITEHNFNLLGAKNIEVLSVASEAFIDDFSDFANLIYIDPDRRDKNSKLFLFEDCSPNIVGLQKRLMSKAETIMVKASPMLDISKALSQLENVSEVHIVAIKNEVKELLFIQKTQPVDSPLITAIDLGDTKKFEADWGNKERPNVGKAAAYLYEPNAAILKSGKADLLARIHNLNKLNVNTQLFTSHKLEEDFPGRIFKINQILKYNKKVIRKNNPSLKANVSVRNFPDSVDEFRNKTGIKPGGSIFLFGIRDSEYATKVLSCSKI